MEEALAIDGVDAAIFFLEEADAVRVTFRSRRGLRVDRLARDLGSPSESGTYTGRNVP